MIERLRDRLPGHTRTQRLGMLRFALSEVRLRCALYAPPVGSTRPAKTKPPTRSEHAFNDVADVLFDHLAGILDD